MSQAGYELSRLNDVLSQQMTTGEQPILDDNCLNQIKFKVIYPLSPDYIFVTNNGLRVLGKHFVKGDSLQRLQAHTYNLLKAL